MRLARTDENGRCAAPAIAPCTGAAGCRRAISQGPVIRTALAQRGDVTSSVSASGVVEPLTAREVKSSVPGQVVELGAEEGDEVKSGQLIARIDPMDTLAAHEQSKADMAAALSEADQADASLDSAAAPSLECAIRQGQHRTGQTLAGVPRKPGHASSPRRSCCAKHGNPDQSEVASRTVRHRPAPGSMKNCSG